MWWDTRTALAVTLLFGLTLARRDVEMFMTPEDKNTYYVEEGGSKSITCNAVVDKNVKVDLKWSGPSINPSEPQRLSNNPQGEFEKVGNVLSLIDFNNKTAGKYICTATLSPGITTEAPIELVKSCDVGKFKPPTCNESCSAFCGLGPQGAQGRNCDHINGTCLYDCQEHHTGLKCTECDTDRFNPPSCNKTCSPYCRPKPGPDGAKGRKCDHITGTCLYQYLEGYKVPSYTEKTEESDNKAVIGGAVGGSLGLIVGVILLIWCLRRKNMCCKKDEKKVNEKKVTYKDGKVDIGEGDKLTDGSGNGHGKNMAGGLDDQRCETNENEQGASGVSQTHAVSGDGSVQVTVETKEEESKAPLLKASGASQTQAIGGDGNNEAMEQLKNKYEKEKAKRKSLDARVEKLQKQVDDLQRELRKEGKAKGEKERQEKENLKQELDKVTKQRDELLAELKKTSKRCDELQEQMANLNQRVREVEKTKCGKEEVRQLIREMKDQQPAIVPLLPDGGVKGASKDEETDPIDEGVEMDEDEMNSDNSQA